MTRLDAFGWDPSLARHLGEEGARPARIISEQRGRYWAVSEAGELSVELSGRLRFEALSPRELPAVGDWIAMRLSPDGGLGLALGVLPRGSVLERGAAGGGGQEQVLAANVDTAFVVTTADMDFNPRRIERYLSVIYAGGASPVLLINKTDLHPDPFGLLAEAARAFPGVDVLGLSAAQGRGLEALHAHLKPGRTSVLLGSSGVGKSTLLNRLIGKDVQRLGEVRASDQRGRHTTSSRQLFLLPNGSLLIDTPGLRELRLGDAAEGLGRTFADIEAFAERCRFRDCRHVDEPGCAVLEALREGALERSRYDSYLKLLKEQAYEDRREDPSQKANMKRRWKSVHKDLRDIQRLKRGGE